MPLSREQRERIVHEAKTWFGTPYRGWSRVKGAGTDCGQFIYGVFRNCGLVPEMELPKDYSLQVAQHRASREYVDFVDQFCRDIPESEVQPGDLVLYQLGRAYAHGAIVVSWPDNIIQADGRYGVSGAHGTKSPAFRRAPRVFRTLKDELCVTECPLCDGEGSGTAWNDGIGPEGEWVCIECRGEKVVRA